MRHSRSYDSIVTDDSSLSASGSGFSKFSKWIRNAQSGGCAAPHVEKGMKIAPKSALKSKVCFIYEKIFEGMEVDEAEVGCWQDFWLLKVDEAHLRDCLALQTEDELEAIQQTTRAFLSKAKGIVCDASQHVLRRKHALQTLTTFFWGILSKPNYSNFAVSVLNIIAGVYQSQAFFTDLIKTVLDVFAAKGRVAQLRFEAVRLLESIVCGQKNTAINSLIEIPSNTLTPSFFDEMLAGVGDAATDADVRVLNVLSVLTAYERTEQSKSTITTYLRSLKGEGLANCERLLRGCLHSYNKGFTLCNRYSSFKSAGLLTSLTSAAYSYLYTPSDLGVLPCFDPQSAGYTRVPAPLFSCILLISELANNQSFVDGLVRKASGDVKEYFKYLSDGVLQDGKPFVCSRLLLEMFLTSSILFQGNKHRLVTTAAHGFLAIWDKLCSNSTFMHFMYTAEPDAQYITLEKTLSKWIITASAGHRITGPRDNPPGGAPIGVLLTLVDEFVSVNLVGNFQTGSYETAVSLLNTVYFYQLEAKLKVCWDSTHLHEKVFQLTSHLTRTDGAPLDTPQGGKLLRAVTVMFRLLLRHPTLLPSAQDKAKFIYEMVRCRDVLAGLEANIRRTLSDGSAIIKTVTSSNLSAAAAYAQELLDLIDDIGHRASEAGCAGDRQQVIELIHDLMELEETNAKHGPLWTLPKSVTTALANPTRDTAIPNSAEIRNAVAEVADPRFKELS